MDFTFPLPKDSYVEWRKRTNEPLMDFFKEAEWLSIFSDVTSADDLEDLMNIVGNAILPTILFQILHLASSMSMWKRSK